MKKNMHCYGTRYDLDLYIPCMVRNPLEDDVKEGIIEDVVDKIAGDEFDFRFIINGKIVNPVYECIEADGICFSELGRSGRERLNEWFQSMRMLAATEKTVYFTDEDGNRYWYEKDGFGRHYEDGSDARCGFSARRADRMETADRLEEWFRCQIEAYAGGGNHHMTNAFFLGQKVVKNALELLRNG